MQTLLPDDELIALNIAFEEAHPARHPAVGARGSGLERIAIASAFQAEGTVVMHMATQIAPGHPDPVPGDRVPVRRDARVQGAAHRALGLNVVDLVGEYTVARQEATYGPRLFERDPERCCEINKVRPMFEALRGLDAWITAFRRDSSPTRATAPFVEQYELEPGR